MSGIAGIIHFDGQPVNRHDIMRLTAAMANRGPDGAAHWIDGPVALGHCMLRTTPESAGEVQPLANVDQSLVIVMDGRLDNYRDLRSQLLSAGQRLKTASDTELVLRAYEIWGEGFLAQIEGDFALAIWNSRERRLICARDRFGVKPFHYYRSQTFFAFATDEEAFLGLEAIPAEPNEDRIACTFVPEFDGVDFADSWLKAIKKLAPAQQMVVESHGGTRTSSYWELRSAPAPRLYADGECVEMFRTLLSRSLDRRMRCSEVPGLMLSGGIDSAVIAGASRSPDLPNGVGRMQTFSVIAESVRGCDETANIRKIIRAPNPGAHLIDLSYYEEPAGHADLTAAAWEHAHPVSNSILLPAMMYSAAAHSGVRVMFDGIDGDLVTDTPTRYFAPLIRAGAWHRALRECRLASLNHTYLRSKAPALLWALGCWDVVADLRTKHFVGRSIAAIQPRKNCSADLLSTSFRGRIHFRERLAAWQSAKAHNRAHLREPERHICELLPVGIPRGMEAFDRVAGRYGVEPRHPWIDRELIEFFINLPLHAKVRNGWTKFAVRTGASSWLDSQVCWNSNKNHLGWDMHRTWVVREREIVRSALRGEGGDLLRPYLDDGRRQSLWRDYESNAISGEDLEHVCHCVAVAGWLLRLKQNRFLHRKRTASRGIS